MGRFNMNRSVQLVGIVLVLSLCCAGFVSAAFTQTGTLKFASATKDTYAIKVNSSNWLANGKYGNMTKYYYPNAQGSGVTPSNAAGVQGYTAKDFGALPGAPDISGLVFDNKLMSPTGSDRPWTKISPSQLTFGIQFAGTYTRTDQM